MIFFNDPRLNMTVAGRLIVRVVTWIAYLVLIAATFTFLISSATRVRFAGIFLALVLIDIFIHRHDGDATIAQVSKSEINVARVVRPAAFALLERAFDMSVIAKQNFFVVATERLLEAPEVEEVLRRLDVSMKEFKDKLTELASPQSVVQTREDRLKSVESLAVRAYSSAAASGHAFVEVGDLFATLPEIGDEKVSRLFELFSITPSDIERAYIFASAPARYRGFGRAPALLGGFTLETHRHIRHRVMNRAWTSRPTPTLDQYGSDLTDLAREGAIGFLVGHDEEYRQLVEALARPTNPNALLVGDAGIGKEAIVQHLAFRLSKDDVPKSLFDKRLVSLDLQNLITGATADVLRVRLATIVEEIYVAGNIILYIPDIHNLMKTSGEGFLSAADALMPVITNNAFPIIGATSPGEFKQVIEPRSDFTSAFEVIHVNEISEVDAEKIATYVSLILEKQAGVTISFGAVKRAVALAKKYPRGKFLPASAEETLKAAVALAERGGEKAVGPELITKVVEAATHIPIQEAGGAEAERLLNMEDIIHERLIDQEEAVHAVATSLREYRSGLARKGGPIASFLFVGPTGVGKTELAKILSDVQFGGKNGAMMTRFDMTEYQDKASFVRFIGSPDGKTRGVLTDAVLEKPYSLILFDEFEKAYPDILDLFLQVLDDGRLTDGLGRIVDFSNTIIIATSNAHSDIINDALAKGQSMTDIADELRRRLVDVFKSELINRFSKIIIFKNLESAQLQQIAAANLAELAASLKEQNISLAFDPAALAEIARLGYDPAFGARPLRRVIEEKVRAPLAEAILGKKVAKGAKITLVYKEGKFAFEAAE